MKFKRIILSLITAFLFSALLVSNGKDDTSNGEFVSDGPFEKYPEPVTITAAIAEAQIEDSRIPEGLTPQTQSWVKLVKDNLNIDLDYIWTVPTDQFKQKLSLSIASGDIPNVLSVGSDDFEHLRESGLLIDMADSYDRVASDDLKAAIESDGGLALNACTIDGELLALPRYMDPYQQVQLIWLREDWRKTLELPEPESMADLLEIMRAFALNDPDGNGENDTFGLGLNKELISWGFDMRGLLNSFGAYGESWIEDEQGQLVFGDIQEEVYDTLALLRKLYGEGIIDPEYAVKDHNRVSEDIVGGKIGLVFGEWWYPNWPFNMNMENQNEAKWKCYPLVSSDSGPVEYGVKRNWINTYAVSSQGGVIADGAVKMQNLFYDIYQFGETSATGKYGIEATPEGGFVYNWVPQRTYYPLTFKQNYFAIQNLLETGEEYVPRAEILPDVWAATVAYRNGSDPSPSNWGLYYSRAASDGGWGLTENVRAEGRVRYDEFYGAITPTQVERGDTLKRLRDETFHKIIMGTEPLSAFNDYVANWKKLGGDDITAEANAWYRAQ